MQTNTFKAATKLAAYPSRCDVIRVQGYYKAAADAWLLIFDSAAEPAANAVPKKSYALPYNAPFSWAFDPGQLALTNGCYVAVSSTEEKYTTVAFNGATTWCDIEVDFIPVSFRASDYSVAGDLTTDVGSLQVWATAAGPKRLFQVDYVNGSGGAAILMLFAHDAPQTGDRPLVGWVVENGASLSLSFGDVGLDPREWAGANNYKGCTLIESAQTDDGTLIDTAVNTSQIRAYYK